MSEMRQDGYIFNLIPRNYRPHGARLVLRSSPTSGAPMKSTPCSVPEQIEQARKPLVRARVTSIKRLPKYELQRTQREYALELSELDELRPKTRGDCEGGVRPCPWVGCKYSLLLDVSENGSIKENLGPIDDLDFDQVHESCALDIADRGGDTLEAVGQALDMTKERIRQLENVAIARARAEAELLSLRDYTADDPQPEFVRRVR